MKKRVNKNKKTVVLCHSKQDEFDAFVFLFFWMNNKMNYLWISEILHIKLKNVLGTVGEQLSHKKIKMI